MPPAFTRFVQFMAVICLALFAYLATMALQGERPAFALPEYSPKTGEPCATCHVNPGGGGPRTLRGLLWAANGQPEAVPQLPGILIAPGVSDGAELYDIACAACHGFQGEGLFAMGLLDTGISKPAAKSFIQYGIPTLGMPAFEGQFNGEQLESLVDFVAGLASGEAEPLPKTYPLLPVEVTCSQVLPTAVCPPR